MFNLSSVTEAEVDKIILNFNDSAAGWDELKLSIIKTVKDSIIIPLASIGNLFDTPSNSKLHISAIKTEFAIYF